MLWGVPVSLVVIFVDGRTSLLLSGVKRNKDGSVKTGFVENGLWDFEIRKGEFLCKSGNYIVNRFPAPDFTEMKIPKSVKGDYNEIMYWAQEKLDKENNDE